MTSSTPHRFVALLLSASVLALSGCGGDGDRIVGGSNTPPSDSASSSSAPTDEPTAETPDSLPSLTAPTQPEIPDLPEGEVPQDATPAGTQLAIGEMATVPGTLDESARVGYTLSNVEKMPAEGPFGPTYEFTIDVEALTDLDEELFTAWIITFEAIDESGENTLPSVDEDCDDSLKLADLAEGETGSVCVRLQTFDDSPLTSLRYVESPYRDDPIEWTF